MSEYYEGQNACLRCLRSSPIASLLGFIAVLTGGGAFGGATIFARRHMDTIIDADHQFPYLEHAVYGLVGVTGLFAVLAYFVCAVSSGRNAKQCFESSRKSACGRCCNMTTILCIVLGIVVWMAILCLQSYSLISVALLQYRCAGPTRLWVESMGGSGLVRGRRGTQEYDLYGHKYQGKSLQDVESYTPDSSSFNTPRVDWPENPVENRPPQIDYPDKQTVQAVVDEGLSAARDQTKNLTANPGVVLSNQVPQNLPDKLQQQGKKLVNQALSAVEFAKLFSKCDADRLDLSYYGHYDANGLPLQVDRVEFLKIMVPLLICTGVAFGGIFLMILGYIQLLICTAMNFARLQERRYYEASDVGEEGVALQQ